jgi:hypothetical protein
MKGHTGQVITFGAKNFYGTNGILPDWASNGGHPGDNALTAYMTNANFGGKVVLWCMDAMYPSPALDGAPYNGVGLTPFNGKQMSSFIMSLDGVAEECVSYDFWSTISGQSGGTNYINNAAAAGVGVADHWNNSTAKQYAKNLNPASTGIELVSVTLGGQQSVPGTLALSAATYSVAENGGSLTVTVTRTSGTTGAVSVNYATSDGTAKAGVKYTAVSGTLTFADGSSASQTFSVPIIDNTVVDGNMTFNVTLSGVTGGATLGASSAVVTIVDNEGPTEIAQGKPATSSSNEDGTLGPANAFDGNTTTRWSSAFADPQWIYVNLGAVYSISQVNIMWENASAQNYQIQVSSDAATWTTISTQTNMTTGPRTDNLTGLSGSGQYVRMYGTTRNTPYGYSIYEFKVYGTTGTVNKAPTVSITSPANNAHYANAPASVAVSANATDSDGSVAKVDFYNGATLAGTVTTAPYQYTFAGLAVGNYTLKATATDDKGATASASVTVSVGNYPPTVSITSPANNASFIALATVTVTAAASDADGSVAKVELFNGVASLGALTAAPYSWTLAGLAIGTYTLKAVATDNLGATANSVITITVNAAGAAEIAHGKPATSSSNENGTFGPANAFDGDVTTRWSSAFADPQWIYVNLGAVYTISQVNIMWENASAQNYQIQVSSDAATWTTISTQTNLAVGPRTDNLTGLSGTGQYVRMYGTTRNTPYGYSIYEFKVYGTTGNVPPVVTITSPAKGTNYATVPSNVVVQATASDADGSVAKVDFYNGATLAGTVTAAPYTWTFAALGAGSYTLKAVATDNKGATSADSVNVTVGSLPPAPITLNPSKDALVRGGANGATNYGTLGYLEAKTEAAGVPDYWRNIIMGFDISGFSGVVDAATLQLYRTAGQANVAMTVFQCSNTSWTETGITWNTMPAIGASITSVNLTAVNGWYNFDVTPYVAAQKAAGATSITFVLVGAEQGPTTQQSFSSKEGANKPALGITFHSAMGKKSVFPDAFAKINWGLGIQDYSNGAIHFTLPSASGYTLSVFNLRGIKAAEVAHGSVTVGTNTAAVSLPQGVYLVRLAVQNGASVDKMLRVTK